MKFSKDGDSSIFEAAEKTIAGIVTKHNEAPASLKREYLKAARKQQDVVRKGLAEVKKIPKGISRREWDERVSRIDTKYNISTIESRFNSLGKQIKQYDPPEGYKSYFMWMKVQLGIVKSSSNLTKPAISTRIISEVSRLFKWI